MRRAYRIEDRFCAPVQFEVKVSALYKELPNYRATNIIAATCAVLNLSRTRLMSDDRQREYADGRKIAMAIIRQSLPAITKTKLGQIFKRDHSSVCVALNSFTDLMATDKHFQDKYKRVLKQFERDVQCN